MGGDAVFFCFRKLAIRRGDDLSKSWGSGQADLVMKLVMRPQVSFLREVFSFANMASNRKKDGTVSHNRFIKKSMKAK